MKIRSLAERDVKEFRSLLNKCPLSIRAKPTVLMSRPTRSGENDGNYNGLSLGLFTVMQSNIGTSRYRTMPIGRWRARCSTILALDQWEPGDREGADRPLPARQSRMLRHESSRLEMEIPSGAVILIISVASFTDYSSLMSAFSTRSARSTSASEAEARRWFIRPIISRRSPSMSVGSAPNSSAGAIRSAEDSPAIVSNDGAVRPRSNRPIISSDRSVASAS
jgi:hypothetical protein